ATLRAHGVERFCFFSYAHKPGMARDLNRWVAETARDLPGAVPLGTLHPDDADVVKIAHEALDEHRRAGFKFHCSVQRFRADDPPLFCVSGRAAAEGRVFVLHAGTMPSRDDSPGVAHARTLLDRFLPSVVRVAHLGCFEPAVFL